MARELSKHITEILKEGTPKQKAVLICRDYTDRENNSLKPLLTKAEAEALRNSLKTNAEKKEFNKWIQIYNTYARMAPTFGLVYSEYKVCANAMLYYIREWEDYCREESHLNYILEELKETKNEQGVKSFYEVLEYMKLPHAKIELDKDGLVEVNIGSPEDYEGKLYGHLLMGREKVKEYLVNLKAVIQVLDDWTKRMNSEDIIPPLIVQSIEQAKEDYSLLIAPAYSEHELNKRIEKGEKVTRGERIKALFPDYDKVEVPKVCYDSFKERIIEIYESERN